MVTWVARTRLLFGLYRRLCRWRTDVQCEDGSFSGRGGCFHWPTLANEAAGGPILRKGVYKYKLVVNLEFIKGIHDGVWLKHEWTPDSTLATLCLKQSGLSQPRQVGQLSHDCVGAVVFRLVNVKLALYRCAYWASTSVHVFGCSDKTSITHFLPS